MNIYDFTVKDVKENDVPMETYKGKVLLIVNTATKCGLTPQLEGLETTYQNFKEQPFEILSFPSNQFLNQTPESNEVIEKFCRFTYDITFKIFAKIDVNGENAHPLYQFLREQQPKDIENEHSVDSKKSLKI
jgi:glutathione peroxidase